MSDPLPLREPLSWRPVLEIDASEAAPEAERELLGPLGGGFWEGGGWLCDLDEIEDRIGAVADAFVRLALMAHARWDERWQEHGSLSVLTSYELRSRDELIFGGWGPEPGWGAWEHALGSMKRTGRGQARLGDDTFVIERRGDQVLIARRAMAAYRSGRWSCDAAAWHSATTEGLIQSRRFRARFLEAMGDRLAPLRPEAREKYAEHFDIPDEA